MDNEIHKVSKWEVVSYNIVFTVFLASSIAYPYIEVEILGAEPTLFDPILFYGGLLLYGFFIRQAWLVHKHGLVEYPGYGVKTVTQKAQFVYGDLDE